MFAHPIRFQSEQFIPVDLKTAWAYFNSPSNLEFLTPDYMKFQVLTPKVDLRKMYPGQIITYFVQPVLGIPLKWTTEITQVSAPHFFIDEQRFGPYKLWHHQHHFEETEGGVVMKDIIHYLLPLGPLGYVARKLFVERQLKGIFDYRREKIKDIF